jgi:hypothetical protein
MNPPVVSVFVDAILSSLGTIANVGRIPGSIKAKKLEDCHIVPAGGNTSPVNCLVLPAGLKVFHKSHMLFVWYLQGNAAGAPRTAVGFYSRVPISPGASQVKDPDAMLFFGTDATPQLRAFSAKQGVVTKIQTADPKLSAGTDLTWAPLAAAPFSQLVFPSGNATCFDANGHNDPSLLATANVAAVEVYCLGFTNTLLTNEIQLGPPKYPNTILKQSQANAQLWRERYGVEDPFRVYVLGRPRNGKSSLLLSLINAYGREAGKTFNMEHLVVNHGGQHGTTALQHFSMQEHKIDLPLILTDVYGIDQALQTGEKSVQQLFAGHYESKSIRGNQEERWPASERKPPHLIIGVISAEFFCNLGSDSLIEIALGQDGFLRRNAQSSFIHHNVLLIVTKWDDPNIHLDGNTTLPDPYSLATSPFIAKQIQLFSASTGIPAANIIPTINIHSEMKEFDMPQVLGVNRFILERMWQLIGDNLAWNRAKQQSPFAENVCPEYASARGQEPVAAPSGARVEPISAATSSNQKGRNAPESGRFAVKKDE